MQFELAKARQLTLPIDPNSVDLEWFVTMLEQYDEHGSPCQYCPNSYLSNKHHTGNCGVDAVRDMSKWLADNGYEIPAEFKEITKKRLLSNNTILRMRESLRRLLDETNTPSKDPTSLFTLLD